MCGRFYIDEEIYTDARTFADRVAGNPLSRPLPSDVYPNETAPVLAEDGQEVLFTDMRWGFPRQRQKGLYINARAETALTKPTFKDSVRCRRLVVPARHFYEWDPEKNKVTFRKDHDDPLYIAGFYNLFDAEDRFVILTTEANASVSPVHPRMPLLLERDEVKPWLLSPAEVPDFLKKRPGPLEHQQEYEQQGLFD